MNKWYQLSLNLRDGIWVNWLSVVAKGWLLWWEVSHRVEEAMADPHLMWWFASIAGEALHFLQLKSLFERYLAIIMRP